VCLDIWEETLETREWTYLSAIANAKHLPSEQQRHIWSGKRDFMADSLVLEYQEMSRVELEEHVQDLRDEQDSELDPVIELAVTVLKAKAEAGEQV
jgi:hypothetical protein